MNEEPLSTRQKKRDSLEKSLKRHLRKSNGWNLLTKAKYSKSLTQKRSL